MLGRLGVAERALEVAHDGIDDDHRGDLATRHDVRADRQRLGRDVRVDTVVEALVAAAQQDDRRAGGELAGVGVVERAARPGRGPPRAACGAPRRGRAAERALHRGHRHVDAQQHARAAAVGRVVDHPVLGSEWSRRLCRRSASGPASAFATCRSSTSHENQLGNSVTTSISSVIARSSSGSISMRRASMSTTGTTASTNGSRRSGVEQQHVVRDAILHRGHDTEAGRRPGTPRSRPGRSGSRRRPRPAARRRRRSRSACRAVPRRPRGCRCRRARPAVGRRCRRDGGCGARRRPPARWSRSRTRTTRRARRR